MKVKKIFERLNECLRKGYLKAGMQHNIFAQIFATIYSLEKLRLDAEIQSHSVDFRQCELADHICVCVCVSSTPRFMKDGVDGIDQSLINLRSLH